MWAEAVNAVVYMINRTGTSSVKGKSPYTLWFNSEADIKHFHVFGSEMYTHVPKKRMKCDPKSVKGILVGYQENSKAFRVYIPEWKTNAVKARLVTKGFEQNNIFDLGKINAPVAKLATMRILLADANQLDLPIY
ncbi:hypothetical protein PR048_014816 [Dryococelus australis]|uniref:Retroviral polymerase SH3-like domain-containing protein n=1 Tax=Dryococelus australis TaxID=614101 RepID=A0ABQ9HF76_9NEOP|nr:hypothetical protein PR048_014816 [Dryococelus australis]